MCVQCGCLDPRNAAGTAAAWAETGQRQMEARLREEIDYLKARVVNLEKMLGIYKEPEQPKPPVMGDKTWRQPGVRW